MSTQNSSDSGPERSHLATIPDPPTAGQALDSRSSAIPDASQSWSSANANQNSSLSTAALAELGQRYDLIGEAGHGSMGNVYKARDRETGETVALKLLKPEIASDQAMMDRFKNELLFARKITHKNVCRVYEFNRIGGVAYTSMEFVEGESLRSVMNRFGGLPQRKGIDLALQICSGLKEAHAQGIVHRDLKPENVMIDARGNVKLMDFGIARSMESITRLTGAMVGTPAYMAPEQAQGKPVDYRTDIYSLGLMLYEIFTGEQAFRADNPVAVALKQMNEAPLPPHEIEPSIPVFIERAILKCIEKDPAKRFQSIAELEAALGSTTAASAGAAAPVSRRVNPSGHASHSPTLLSSAPATLTTSPTRKPKRKSAAIWIVAAALAILVAGAAAKRSAIVWHTAQSLQAPTSLPLPIPPAMAFERTPAPAPAEKLVEKSAEKSAEQPVEKQLEKPVAKAEADTAIAPARVHTGSQSSAPISQPAVAAAATLTPPSGQTSTPSPASAPQPLANANKVATGAGSSFGDRAPYLLVGRFRLESRAQDAAKKIEDLKLPVTIVPRHTLTGDFYFVLSGPYGPQKIPDVMLQLQAAGFAEVHPVKTTLARENSNP